MRALTDVVAPAFSVFLVKWILRAIVIDRLLTSGGEIQLPFLFAPAWFILVLLNFVWAVWTVPFRFFGSVIQALYMSSLMDCTVFPEWAIAYFDPGYAAFLALAFTQSNRRNLVRRCFLTLLVPYLHVASPPAPPTWEEVHQRRTRLKVRNKFWVAVTLWNNPELRQYRRRTLEKEAGSLKMLTDEASRKAQVASWKEMEAHDAKGQETGAGDGQGSKGETDAEFASLEDEGHNTATSFALAQGRITTASGRPASGSEEKPSPWRTTPHPAAVAIGEATGDKGEEPHGSISAQTWISL
jgi:hypothetical protein